MPLFTVVLRKAYGLGAMSVAGGSLHAPFFTVAWPTAEFGAMGLEGAVLLAMRKQLGELAERRRAPGHGEEHGERAARRGEGHQRRRRTSNSTT